MLAKFFAKATNDTAAWLIAAIFPASRAAAATMLSARANSETMIDEPRPHSASP